MDKTVRLPLIENYDQRFGYITDAFVDPEGDGRKPLMARPSIGNPAIMGLPPNNPPVTGYYQIVAQKVIQVILNDNSTAKLYSFIYAGQKPGFPGVYVYGLGVWKQTNSGNLMLGGTNLTNGVGITEQAPRAQFSAAANPIYTMTAAVVAPTFGGAGYNIGDTITLSYNGINRYLILQVTGVTAGAVTSVSISNAGAVPAPLTNPVPQLTTSGGGTGAKFNLSFSQAEGLVFQWGSMSNNVGFVGITLDTASYVEQTLFGDQNTPNPFIPSVVVLNNYNFFLDTKGNLWNTDVGDPANINGLSFVQAFSNTATQPKGLSVHNGYLVAIGNNQIRFFQITGAINGSSVVPIQNLDFGIGSSPSTFPTSSNGISNQDEHLVFVGETDSISTPIYVLRPNSLVPEKITYPYLSNFLAVINASGFIKFRDHLCYFINSGGIIFVYDFLTKIWARWNVPVDSGNNTSLFDAVDMYADVTYMFAYSTANNVFYFDALLGAGNDSVIGFTAPAYVPSIVLKPQDFGTVKSKQFRSAAIIGDKTVSALNVTLSYSDDEGLSFSTPRTIALNQNRPITRNLGRSYRRCWKLTLPTNWSARIDALEIDAELGTT